MMMIRRIIIRMTMMTMRKFLTITPFSRSSWQALHVTGIYSISSYLIFTSSSYNLILPYLRCVNETTGRPIPGTSTHNVMPDCTELRQRDYKGRRSSYLPWASCQIRKIAGAHARGMPGTFSPSPLVSDPDMHHGPCVTHVPWCMPGSLTSGFLWNRRWGKTFPAFPAHAQPAILRIWQEAHIQYMS